MLSIIVPAYQEPFLGKTIESLLANATGEIEIIPILDGWTPNYPLPLDERVKPLSLSANKGKRGALNAGIAVCHGDFVMLLDAHCIVGPGFDRILSDSCAENWLVVPRRYSLHPEKWARDETRPIVDYHYISFPSESPWGFGMYARPWRQMAKARMSPEFDIDDAMTVQASSWVASRKYLTKYVYPFDDRPEAYGSLAQDQQEIALKYWLGSGEVKVNKKTWYAHISKRWYHYSDGTFSRLHKKDDQYIKGNTWGTLHWLRNEEPRMIHPFNWLIEKFWPVPSWPDNWREILTSKA